MHKKIRNKHKKLEVQLLTGGIEQMKQRDKRMVHEGTGKREQREQRVLIAEHSGKFK